MTDRTADWIVDWKSENTPFFISFSDLTKISDRFLEECRLISFFWLIWCSFSIAKSLDFKFVETTKVCDNAQNSEFCFEVFRWIESIDNSNKIVKSKNSVYDFW